MSTGRRLALFAAALVAVFAVAFGVAAVAVPDSVVHSWKQRAQDSHQEMSGGHDPGHDAAQESPADGLTAPVSTAPRTADHVDGFHLALSGTPMAGHDTPLAITVTRDGAGVTTLQPYLGAFGHLVALRESDLGYLPVHPAGAEPRPGQTSGPRVAFTTRAPGAGRYLLYFDFQVGGVVRTATFVVDAVATR